MRAQARSRDGATAQDIADRKGHGALVRSLLSHPRGPAPERACMDALAKQAGPRGVAEFASLQQAVAMVTAEQDPVQSSALSASFLPSALQNVGARYHDTDRGMLDAMA